MTFLLFSCMYKPDNSNFWYKFLLAHGQSLKVARLWLLPSKVLSYHHRVYTRDWGQSGMQEGIFVWGRI